VGLKGVAELGVVNQMFLVASTLTGLLAAPLWPAFRDAVIRKDRGWIDRTLSRSIKISFGISLSVTIPILLLGGWVGEWMAANQFVPTFSVLFAVFVWTNVQAVNGVLAMLLNGLQVIRLQLALSFLMTVVNLVLSLVLVQWIGVSGVIWGSIIANICCMLIPYWLLLPRIIDKHMGEKPLGD
jgi:O-antigen/teichoic acid export membrane protein